MMYHDMQRHENNNSERYTYEKIFYSPPPWGFKKDSLNRNDNGKKSL